MQMQRWLLIQKGNFQKRIYILAILVFFIYLFISPIVLMDVQMHLAWASVVHSCIKFLQFLKKSYKQKLVVTKRNLFFPLFMKLGKLMTILNLVIKIQQWQKGQWSSLHLKEVPAVSSKPSMLSNRLKYSSALTNKSSLFMESGDLE